jgi:hypothetical protein
VAAGPFAAVELKDYQRASLSHGGGQPTPISHEFSVTDADHDAIQELIHRVEITLEQADQQQKNVIMAALAELSARYMRKTDETPTKRRKAVGP